jgi:hypothetical protein
MLLAILITVRDWADLAHALAWPVVALTAIFLFKKSLSDALADILKRIPLERATHLKTKGAELKMGRDAKIPFGEVPKIPKEKSSQPEATS